jgi:hypothetical protein
MLTQIMQSDDCPYKTKLEYRNIRGHRKPFYRQSKGLGLKALNFMNKKCQSKWQLQKTAISNLFLFRFLR